jgi:UDP-3-O-[3-hydroxymyristoyl] glucosamine N-acyltransferase
VEGKAIYEEQKRLSAEFDGHKARNAVMHQEHAAYLEKSKMLCVKAEPSMKREASVESTKKPPKTLFPKAMSASSTSSHEAQSSSSSNEYNHIDRLVNNTSSCK